MRRFITTVLVSATFLGGVAVAADPVVGSSTLDVAKSKFSPGPAPKTGTRVYSESADGQTLEGKTVGASGKGDINTREL